MINRRVFSGAISAALLGTSAVSAGKLALHVGHTGLTWIPLGGRITPPPPINPMVDPQYVQAAIGDIAGLGYYGIELFGNQIEAMQAQGGGGALLDHHKLPLISAYCSTNLSDPRLARMRSRKRWTGRSSCRSTTAK
jgi:inosose dehydratase